MSVTLLPLVWAVVVTVVVVGASVTGVVFVAGGRREDVIHEKMT